jgi:DNA repair photolyase
MKGINRRYRTNPQLRLDEKELNANYGSNNFIFVGSSTDMFSGAIPTEWIEQVYNHCLKYDTNRYLFQSKNPMRFLEPALISHPLMERRESVVFATTIETNRDCSFISKAAPIKERVEGMIRLRQEGFDVRITGEPIMDFDLEGYVDIIQQIRPSQVYIGCNTTRSIHLHEPNREKLIELINRLRQITTVFLKSNSSRLLGDISMV